MPEVFIKKTEEKKPGFNVATTMQRQKTEGEIGLEIEVEGNKFPKPPGSHGTHHPVAMVDMPEWSYVHDGSLRGNDNAEYILTKPIMFDAVPEAISKLYGRLDTHGSIIDDSNRTSVHVHLNCQPFHFDRLTSFMAMYFTLEEILTEWCGEHRVGNLFCLRAKDANAIISKIKKFIQTDGQYELPDNLHYAGLNAQALKKFGSLEIRTLRGCSDPQVILDWVSILERLYKLSGEISDPRDIMGTFSSGGPMSFFESILGDKAGIVRNGIGFTTDEITTSLYEGIRLAQDLCYCRDWSNFQPMALEPDPFGRSIKTVLKKMGTAGGMDVGEALASINAGNTEVQLMNYGPLTGAMGGNAPSPYFTSQAPDWLDEPEPEYDDGGVPE